MWYLYILEGRNKSLYIGITNNLKRRLKEHNGGKVHFTSYNLPVKIVCTEPYPTKSQTVKREAQIKRWSRKKKLALIKSDLRLLKEL